MVGKNRLTPGRCLLYLFLLLLAFTTVYPIVWMILSAFKSNPDYLTNLAGLPRAWIFTNFKAVLRGFDILGMLKNSLTVVLASLVLLLLFSTMASFSVSKLRFRGRRLVERSMLLIIMVPAQALMLPIYVLVANLGLINNLWSIILVNVATTMAFAVYMLAQSCKEIPDDILEAAKIDGASYPKMFLRIIVPMLKPSITTIAILDFLTYWNEVVFSRLFLQRKNLQTMTLGVLTLKGGLTMNYPLLLAGMTLNMIPAMVVYIVFNKYLTKGIAMGSGK